MPNQSLVPFLCLMTMSQRTRDGETNACDDACDNGSDLHHEADSCTGTSDDGHIFQHDGEASACNDARDNGIDLHDEVDSCTDASDDDNPLIDYPTCANYNCNRPSNRPGIPGALCCPRCPPISHSRHTTSCNRAWIEEMLLDLEHTASSSRAVTSPAPLLRALWHGPRPLPFPLHSHHSHFGATSLLSCLPISRPWSLRLRLI